MIREQHPIGDPTELAALYCAGAMTADELTTFEAHLDGGCSACAAVVHSYAATVEALLSAVAPVAPRAETRDRLLQRIDQRADAGTPAPGPQVWKAWNPDSPLGSLLIRRKDEGAWEETGVRGVRVRRLFVDAERNQTTMLIRMDAGAGYPRHVHDGPEECLVLEGDLHVGDAVLSAGDYQRADVGSTHGLQRTENGCLLLIVSSLTDELLP